MSTKVFRIPKRSHGALIGKGGATIKLLQTNFNAKITIPGSDDPSDGVSVAAKPEDIERLRQEFEKILGFKVGTDALESANLDIRKEDHGALIGKQGSVLKGIENQYGVNLDIPRREDASNIVVVQGPKQGVEGAVHEIGKLLGYAPRRVGASAAVSLPEAKQSTLKLDYSKPIQHALFFPDPDGSNFDLFVDFLDAAQKTLDICVFTISDDRVSRAIINRHRNGVKVRIITDNDTSTNLGSDIQTLANNGIDVKTDTSPFHMHHKFAIVDGQVLINGSFNWTKSAATTNSENLTITNEKFFVQAFQQHFAQSWVKKEFILVAKK